jgi:hypothetical protein
MGLYGALVVHSAAAGTAYPGVPFDAEKVLVLSEIDPVLNADPLAFNHYTYAPRYWLINGKAFPQTDEIVAQPGQNLLLRYLNAGLTNQTMTLLGADQRVVATDAWPVNYTADVVSQIIPAGQTIDTIVEVPANLPAGSDIPLYNRHMHVVNGGFFPGGMASFVTVRQPGVLAGLTAGWLGGSPRPRTPMLFRARVTSGTNVTYTWDFGDGMIQQGYLVWHTFPEFGIYTVTITATSGAEQIQQILTVPIVGLPMYFPFITR